MTQSTKRIGEGVFWLSLNGKKAEKVEHYSKLEEVGGGGGGVTTFQVFWRNAKLLSQKVQIRH